MNTEFLITEAEVEQLVEKHFHSIIDQRIIKHQKFLENISRFQMKLLNSTSEENSDIQRTINVKVYKVELTKLLKKYYEKSEPSNFDQQFPELITQMNKLSSKHKKEEIRVQNNARFESRKNEKFTTKVGKSIKKAGFQLSKIETLFSSTKASEHKWHHKVNGRNISLFYWRENLSQRLITLINPLNRAFNASTILLWDIDVKIDAFIETNELFENIESLLALNKTNTEKALNILSRVKESLRKKSKILIAKNWREYENSIQRAGTFELSNKSFNDDLLQRKHRVLNNSVLNLDNNWNNTKQILVDNWYLDLELIALNNIVAIDVHKTTKNFNKRINETVLPQVDKYREFIRSLKEKIESCTVEDDLQNVLNQCIKDIRTKLNAKMLIETSDVILNAELPELINQLELDINAAIGNISQTTTVHKDTNYNVAIKNNEFTTSPIQELIRFEGWPGYLKKSVELKSKIITVITEMQNEIINHGQVAEFNIQTAIELFDEPEEDKNPQNVATESLERSLESIGNVTKKLQTLGETVTTDLVEANANFSKKLDALHEDESLIAIKLKLAATRAIEKSETLKIKVRETIKNFIPQVVSKFKKWYGLLIVQINKYKKNLGIKEEVVFMDLNLSDFLVEAEQSYSRLPFIYQRLFRNESLSEKTFFVGRSKEIQSLKTALSRFKNNRFAATVILGEKGSGLTSMLNLFVSENSDQIRTIRISNKDTIHTLDELYVLFSSAFDKQITNLVDCASFLNEQPRSMVVMENIHLLFLKKIHGFEIIEELTELISLTSDNVFWIVSCYTYCYNYLNKAIDLSEQFRYIISMDEFADETMVKIIKERHKVSGYALSFLPSMENLNSKKFGALSETDQQILLEKQYFSELNKLVRGNIRLGLAYWLSSTREVSGNRLVISPFINFELTFLRNLTERNLYTLSNLILHDKLTLSDLSDVMNIELNVARRIVQTLEEYGITMEKDGYFSINPLLYRQCLIVLKSKNIIH